MKVRIGKRARRQVERIDAWWREHRDSKELFKRELEDAERFLATTPHLAPVHVVRGSRTIRWLLLPKTEVKLYYWVNDKRADVNVVSAWGGRRERGPKL